MKYIFFLMLCIVTLCLSSCVSKEQKAFEEAVQSRQLINIRHFLAQYPNADIQLLDSAKVLLNEWISDSVDFEELKTTEDVVMRAGLEMSYMDQHPNGLYIDSVAFMYQNDEKEAAAIIERREAIEQHLESYRKKFLNNVFYMDPLHCIILSEPDEEGKGAGTLMDGYLTFYDFRYAIDIEDLNEDNIRCEYTVNGNRFTLELYDKRLYYRAQGQLETFDGEQNEEIYNSFMERVAKINKGEKVYGNPTVSITPVD